jgi:glycosyltransferase involved in cell wall biosynthesis
MKRICIVRHREYPDAVPTRRNAETLVAHGYKVDVVCIKKNGEKNREVIHGVNVYRLPLEHHRKGVLRYIFEYGAFFLLAFLKLSQLSLTRRYQAVQIDNMPDFIVFTALVPRLLGAKIVFQLLDHTPEVFADSFGVSTNHILVKTLRFIEKVSVRWADYCIGTQIINKQIIESHGVPSSKIAVVLNVPDDTFGCDAIASHDNGTFCLMTHGNLLEKYGVQTLIKAVPMLTGEIPNLRVKVVGKGEYRQRLEELAKSLGVEDYVQFTGWVPPDEIAAHIAEAKIGIVSIIVNKNPMLPNKLFEYLALGKPSIAAAIPTIKSYFDEDSVMFYEPDNTSDLASCILELYRNPEKRAALAASGSAVYEKYRWSVTKYEYLKVFDRMIGNGHHKSKNRVPTAGGELK